MTTLLLCFGCFLLGLKLGRKLSVAYEAIKAEEDGAEMDSKGDQMDKPPNTRIDWASYVTLPEEERGHAGTRCLLMLVTIGSFVCGSILMWGYIAFWHGGGK